MIIGTAGHIDHGKTALVRALTGVDTDRLPEERRRGITIELGFAPLALGGGDVAGLVDVPGHEAFVRTMLAGATGIDLALLVVAADEGVMPQTREHLAILSLLGVRGGVVALSKCDLVEPEWLALVTDDVRDALRGTPLADAPMIPTSAETRAGLDELRAALAAAAASVPVRDAADLFRLPVDRAFTVRGTGTVVTGTVWSGALRRDASVRVLPTGRVARVRGLHSHGRAVDEIGPGARAAVALVGVDVADVPRGSVIASDASWAPTNVLRAEVHLLDDAPVTLRARTRVHLHLGTTEVAARIVAVGGGLGAGDRAEARVVLEAPVVARAGDRFVLRSLSPVATIGGGVVVDPLPPHRRVRPWDERAAASPGRRLELALDEAGALGVDTRVLPVRLGVRPDGVVPLADVVEPRPVRVGERLYSAAAVAAVRTRLGEALAALHAASPLAAGVSLQEVRMRMAGAPELVDEVLRAAAAEGAIAVDGGTVHRAGWRPRLSPAQSAVQVEAVRRIASAGAEPPAVSELAAELGREVPALLGLVVRDGRLVAVDPDRYWSATALEELTTTLDARLDPAREYAPAELREVLGVSRKYLIPLLEWLDRRGLTVRTDGGRRWRGPSEPASRTPAAGVRTTG